MQDEAKENYLAAGNIAQKARKLARDVVKPSNDLLSVADAIESLIRDEGAAPAFPVNLSVNEVAAHYTPARDDETEIKDDDLVKVDIGVHVDGYIADTALSINPSGKHSQLIDCTDRALSTAIQKIRDNNQIKTGELGGVIQESITSNGYKPIRNLGGHFLDRWVQHTGDRIPNVNTGSLQPLNHGGAIAIEPFATAGSGKIKETGPGNIYRYQQETRVRPRSRDERKLAQQIEQEFKSLPFTSRWLKMNRGKLKLTLNRLVNKNLVHSYPILKEVGNSAVSQSEHTLLLLEGEVIVTTSSDY